MKYNFTLDEVDPRSAHGKVLARVAPGSTVLECGSASGYMTKYLTEKMECNVTVIEKDRDGYDASMQHAAGGVCGDLEDMYTWSRLAGKKFDFVMFADVLEHLLDPMFAVQHAKELLKDEGRMIVSIPNIAHNDIILALMNDRFSYTKYGLLDDTHVHFWGLKDFLEFCNDAGMDIELEQHVGIPTGRTEQWPKLLSAPASVISVLKNRKFGEVYQFIFTLKKRL